MNKLPTPTLPLADIHLHTTPSYWPLAWGWWLTILLIIIVFTLGWSYLRRRRYTLAAKQEALTLLTHYQAQDGLKAINTLLKQVALSYYPRTQVAHLTGIAWLTFLDQQLPTKYQGFVAQQQQWQQGLFSADALEPSQFEAAKKIAKTWLKHAIPIKKSQKDKPIITTKESADV